MQPPLVTIVSPLYNGERFVRNCMESVLGQTYSNWRYFVLDNACTDRTGEIAREIAADDARIEVVSNPETVPVIENHNVAVALMPQESDYLRILQADDLLRPECIEKSVAVAEANPSVGMVGSHIQWGSRLTSNELETDRSVFGGREIARRVLLGETYPFLSPSGILFRAEVVRRRQPFYDESRLHADVMACYETLRDWDFGMVHEVLTDVGSNEDSVTSRTTQSFNKLLASNLELLQMYGREFLEAPVFDARIAERLENYLEFLARARLEGRSDDFWVFHETALAQAGYPVSNAGLAVRVLRQMLSSPRASARRIYRRFFQPG